MFLFSPLVSMKKAIEAEKSRRIAEVAAAEARCDSEVIRAHLADIKVAAAEARLAAAKARNEELDLEELLKQHAELKKRLEQLEKEIALRANYVKN